jgi:hypothetical protein
MYGSTDVSVCLAHRVRHLLAQPFAEARDLGTMLARGRVGEPERAAVAGNEIVRRPLRISW